MVYDIKNKICTINFMQYHPSLVNDNHWLKTSVTIDYIHRIYYPIFHLVRR